MEKCWLLLAQIMGPLVQVSRATFWEKFTYTCCSLKIGYRRMALSWQLLQGPVCGSGGKRGACVRYLYKAPLCVSILWFCYPLSETSRWTFSFRWKAMQRLGFQTTRIVSVTDSNRKDCKGGAQGTCIRRTVLEISVWRMGSLEALWVALCVLIEVSGSFTTHWEQSEAGAWKILAESCKGMAFCCC